MTPRKAPPTIMVAFEDEGDRRDAYVIAQSELPITGCYIYDLRVGPKKAKPRKGAASK